MGDKCILRDRRDSFVSDAEIKMSWCGLDGYLWGRNDGLHGILIVVR